MSEENPIVRQVSNVLTTLAFFVLIGYLAHLRTLNDMQIACLLGAFTVGTSGVKITRHVTNASQARFRAVRSSLVAPPFPPNDDGGSGGSGGGGNPYTTPTRPAMERQGGPGMYEREPRGKGPGGIIRRVLGEWGPTVLAGVLVLIVLALTSEPIAFATPQDPPTAFAP